jgi:hypothetical protein
MKLLNKVAAALLASSMMAASSFAQSETLSEAVAPSVDEVMLSQAKSSDEVAIFPLIAAVAAGAVVGGYVAELIHHHFTTEPGEPMAVPSESVDALFDR